MNDQLLEQIIGAKQKLESLEANLSVSDREFVISELNTLTQALNDHIEEYLVKIKTLEIKQKI